jgi:hypothetical protein
MAKARKPAAAKPAAKPSKPSAQKPLATGDVNQFPDHVFRADMGEGLPPQAPPPTATDKGK